MYKGASRSLIRSTHVDRPHPARGYIDARPEPSDVLPDAEHMGLDALRAEQAQLRTEVAQVEQQLAVAKAANNGPAISAIGQRKAGLCMRLARVKTAINAKSGISEPDRIKQAMREMLGDEQTAAILARAREIGLTEGVEKLRAKFSS